MKTISRELRDHLIKIGSIGGKARTKEKALAAAQNGKKGGRPRKVVAHESASIEALETIFTQAKIILE